MQKVSRHPQSFNYKPDNAQFPKEHQESIAETIYFSIKYDEIPDIGASEILGALDKYGKSEGVSTAFEDHMRNKLSGLKSEFE